ncbi:MAG TPA: helix-turn-helix domain-containing protein [Candidatus Angelobacter sp.]|nr:helix-turn-helix domain-containing protein [Candidatus Angelobacter sp.]
MEQKLMTVPQVAAYLQCSEDAVRLWERQGKLVAVRIGKLVRFRHEDVALFIGPNDGKN